MDETEDAKIDKYHQVIGKRIVNRRKELKIRQDVLAKAIGLTRTSVVNIEAGRQRTAIHVIYSIADALQTDVYHLLPRDTEEVNILVARVAIRNLAESIGVDFEQNEQELREIVERIERMKEKKNGQARIS